MRGRGWWKEVKRMNEREIRGILGNRGELIMILKGDKQMDVKHQKGVKRV